MLNQNHANVDEILYYIVNFECLDVVCTSCIRKIAVPKEQQTQRTAFPCMNLQGLKNITTSLTTAGTLVRICFNCGSISCIVSEYSKPRIEKGMCYNCGSTIYQFAKCPSLRLTVLKSKEFIKWNRN